MTQSELVQVLCSLEPSLLPSFWVHLTIKFHLNKIMTIATVDKDNNKTIIIAFLVFKFMDSESYYRIFKYLNENYSFSPKYIHTDYELALDLAIKKSDFFNKDIVHLKCFFHFAKSIREKLKKLEKIKKV